MEVLEYHEDAIFPVVSELRSPLGGIQDPAEDLFSLTPSAFAFEELLLGDGFLAVHGREVPLGKNLVHSVHDATSHIGALAPGTLRNANKVVHKDIDMSDGSSVPCEWGPIFGLRERPRELYKLWDHEGTCWRAVPRLWQQRCEC